jgi:hypothetical protein
LLTERRDGTRRLYRARPEGLAGLQEFLDQIWAGSLDTARRLIEADRGLSERPKDRSAWEVAEAHDRQSGAAPGWAGTGNDPMEIPGHSTLAGLA